MTWRNDGRPCAGKKPGAWLDGQGKGGPTVEKTHQAARWGKGIQNVFPPCPGVRSKTKKPLRTGLRAGAGAFLHGIPCALLRCFPGRMGADGALPAQRHAGCFPCARGFYADRVAINWRNAFRAGRCFLYGAPCAQLHTASGNVSCGRFQADGVCHCALPPLRVMTRSA